MSSSRLHLAIEREARQEPEHRREIGQRLIQARMAEGITQHEMAERLDMSTSTVSLLERGRCRGMQTTIEHATTYARHLKLSLDWVVYGEGEGPVLPMRTAINKLGNRPMRQADRIEAKLDLILKHLNIQYR